MEAGKVLQEIEKLSQKSFLPIIGPVKGVYLIDAVKKFKVNKVLEVGTLIGYSAILIASNLPETGRVLTIEVNSHSAKFARENIQKAELAGKIKIYEGNALDIIPTLNESFDMVFIDASKNEYLDYLKLSEDKLKKGGVVFADNVKIFAHNMQNFLDYVRNSKSYRSEFIDIGFDGVEVSEKLF